MKSKEKLNETKQNTENKEKEYDTKEDINETHTKETPLIKKGSKKNEPKQKEKNTKEKRKVDKNIKKDDEYYSSQYYSSEYYSDSEDSESIYFPEKNKAKNIKPLAASHKRKSSITYSKPKDAINYSIYPNTSSNETDASYNEFSFEKDQSVSAEFANERSEDTIAKDSKMKNTFIVKPRKGNAKNQNSQEQSVPKSKSFSGSPSVTIKINEDDFMQTPKNQPPQQNGFANPSPNQNASNKITKQNTTNASNKDSFESEPTRRSTNYAQSNKFASEGETHRRNRKGKYYNTNKQKAKEKYQNLNDDTDSFVNDNPPALFGNKTSKKSLSTSKNVNSPVDKQSNYYHLSIGEPVEPDIDMQQWQYSQRSACFDSCEEEYTYETVGESDFSYLQRDSIPPLNLKQKKIPYFIFTLSDVNGAQVTTVPQEEPSFSSVRSARSQCSTRSMPSRARSEHSHGTISKVVSFTDIRNID